MDTLTESVKLIGQQAREAALKLALVETAQKNKAILAMAALIRKNKAAVVKENAKDVAQATKVGRSKALIDRLLLTEERVEGVAKGLEEIAALDDPVGKVLQDWTRPNGLRIKQVTVPIGVIGMIYESRPNVTAESAALCLKSGNAVVLRGGSEAVNSNRILVDLVRDAADKNSIPTNAVQFLPPEDRRSITILSQLNGLVDLIIARGSEEMIKEVSSKASVPVLGHGKGVCHVYVDKSADLQKAVSISFNSKVQRPGVCNAMETLLIHEHMLYDVLPKIAEKYVKAGVEIRGDDRVRGIYGQAKPTTEEDWFTEYHDKIVSIKVVDTLQEAIDHINKYGSSHTDSIVTEDKDAADLFQKAVDSSCVMVNASTRLHDGGIFGFGSEIGISTNKLHARGTMGLNELTSKKYLVIGNGQIRE